MSIMVSKGTRIEMHPATDQWMRGDRYGTVTKVGADHHGDPNIRVKLDVSKKSLLVEPKDIGRIYVGGGKFVPVDHVAGLEFKLFEV